MRSKREVPVNAQEIPIGDKVRARAADCINRRFAAPPQAAEKTVVVEISVPSGRLIASDDLRSVAHFDVEARRNAHFSLDTDLWARMFADQANTAYAYAGNSCPVVIRTSAGLFEVIEPEFIAGPDDSDIDEPERILAADEIVVAEICTDLWAVMLTDYRNWLDHGGPEVQPGSDEELPTDGKYTLIDVVPGRYRWTIYSHAPEFDHDAEGRICFARLELVEAS